MNTKFQGDQKLKIYQKVISCLILIPFLAGCATKKMSSIEMENKLKGFTLPEHPKAGKAVIYCIYRGDTPFYYPTKVALYYALSTKDKFDDYNSQGYHVLSLLTCGLTEHSSETKKEFLGSLEPGQYLTVHLDPGYYEFTRKLINQSNHIQNTENNVQIFVENGGVYYLLLTEYTESLAKNILFLRVQDPIEGKYILSKNIQPNRK